MIALLVSEQQVPHVLVAFYQRPLVVLYRVIPMLYSKLVSSFTLTQKIDV